MKDNDHPSLLDTSELLRPEQALKVKLPKFKISEHFLKDKEAFRDYDKEDEIGQRVKRTYTEMHTNQTVEFVRGKHEKWLKFNHFQATVMEVGLIFLPKIPDSK